jgi:hypothetical protein
VHEYLALASTGKVIYKLKEPWRDGSTHVVLEPTTLLERLAALIPAPRVKLINTAASSRQPSLCATPSFRRHHLRNRWMAHTSVPAASIRTHLLRRAARHRRRARARHPDPTKAQASPALSVG